jgi:hypothetical protein
MTRRRVSTKKVPRDDRRGLNGGAAGTAATWRIGKPFQRPRTEGSPIASAGLESLLPSSSKAAEVEKDAVQTFGFPLIGRSMVVAEDTWIARTLLIPVPWSASSVAVASKTPTSKLRLEGRDLRTGRPLRRSEAAA